MKETIVYEEMCERCQEWYRKQHSGAAVQDFLIVCNHQPKRSKREDCICPPITYERYPDGTYPELQVAICRCGALNTTVTP